MTLAASMFSSAILPTMAPMAAIAAHMFLGGYYLNVPFTDIDLTYWAGNWKVAFPIGFLGLSEPFVNAISLNSAGFATTLTFLAKMLAMILVFMWIRATEPRFRYDQLMSFGWKRLLPVGLALILITAAILVLIPEVEAESTAKAMEVSLNVQR